MPSGMLRFLVPPGKRFAPRLAEQAYMAGPDQIPWPCRIRLHDGELIVERNVADSGKFYIPWPVEGHGELMLSSATLMERERPYQLLVELARGKINQVRNQLADWQLIGMAVPGKVESALRRALQALARAVTSQHQAAKAAELADRAIVLALDAADLLVSSYVDQALAARHRQAQKLKTVIGANLGAQPLDMPMLAYYLKTFNAAQVPLPWRTIEAVEGSYRWELPDRQIAVCQEHGLALCAGPLVRLDRGSLPDWIYVWEGDFASIQSFVSDFMEKAVSRYKGKVQMWQCAARLNVASGVSLSEEQKLRLAVRAIEVTRAIDPHTPLLVRFDQPWAEYMGRSAPDLSPLHFADALIRAGLQLGAVGLEINMGYSPGSHPRDRLEFSRLIDLWSYLGVPLHLTLAVPSGESADPAVRGRPATMPGGIPGGWSPENQAAWIKHYLPMILAKPAVHAVFWNQLSDGEGAELPFGGLIDSQGAPKPGMSVVAALTRKHLESPS